MIRSKIAGTGSALPEKILTNHDLEKLVDTSDEWVKTRTGIAERRIAVSESTLSLSVKASRKALKAAGISAKDVDLIIVGTVTPDMVFPSTACFIQAELGVKPGVPALDLSAACSGFLYALDIADKYIRSGIAKNALVVGVDLFSRIIDWKDRSTCVLFGDGAGAVLLTPTKGKSGILSSHIHSDGNHWKSLYTPGALEPSPFSSETGSGSYEKPFVTMAGNETFKLAVKTISNACIEALESAGLSKEDVTLLIPHQANTRIIKAVRQRLKIPEEKVFLNIQKYGNTSAGSIPIALDEAVRNHPVKRGDVLLLVAFGGGFTWASAAIRWT